MRAGILRRKRRAPQQSDDGAIVASLHGDDGQPTQLQQLSMSDEVRGGCVIELLQDALWGLGIACVFVVVLLLFDLQFNRDNAIFRSSSSFSLSPDTIKILESETGNKYIPMQTYQSIMDEIHNAHTTIEHEEQILQSRNNKFRSSVFTLAGPLRKEYELLMKQTGLNAFCKECIWGMGMSCQNRVEYMLDKYGDNIGGVEVMASLLKEGKCVEMKE